MQAGRVPSQPVDAQASRPATGRLDPSQRKALMYSKLLGNSAVAGAHSGARALASAPSLHNTPLGAAGGSHPEMHSWERGDGLPSGAGPCSGRKGSYLSAGLPSRGVIRSRGVAGSMPQQPGVPQGGGYHRQYGAAVQGGSYQYITPRKRQHGDELDATTPHRLVHDVQPNNAAAADCLGDRSPHDDDEWLTYSGQGSWQTVKKQSRILGYRGQGGPARQRKGGQTTLFWK